jgi:acyl-CoA reductase-like NAD-dependent aldehyde dehydrogenase
MPHTLTSYDPATGAALGAVATTAPEDLEAVVGRARSTLAGAWSRDAAARAHALHAWADVLAAHADELAGLIMRETGKLRREADFEVAGALDALRFNAGMARHVDGHAGALPDGSIAYVEREPVGVSAFIVPWNAPVILLLRDLAPALAAGVTAIVKPAPQTPLVTERLAGLALEAGLPDGVLAVVHGGAELGRALVEHPAVRAVAFTGSTTTGRAIMRSAAGDFTRVLLELGGKGAAIVFDDADTDAAAAACLQSGLSIAGQFCMATTRVLAQRSVYDDVRAALCERAAAVAVGPPDDDASGMGPLISEQQLERVAGYIEIARAGDCVAIGGERLHPGSGGAYLAPTILAGDDLDGRLLREEIFGPVLTVEPFDEVDDAVALANLSPYGLAGSVWTTDVDRAWAAARGLQAGTVGVNRCNVTLPEIASGGMKQSGMGRTRGLEGVHAFTELRHVNFAPPRIV